MLLRAIVIGAVLVIGAAAAEDVLHPVTNGREQSVRALEARLRVVEDRDEIHKVLNDYGRLLDKRDFDGFARLFADDSEYGSIGTFTKGPAAISASLKEIIERNPGGYKQPNFHVFFNESIDVQGDRATSTSKSAFVVPGDANQPQAVLLASYDDTLIRERGHWKFQRRIVHGDIPVPKPKG